MIAKQKLLRGMLLGVGMVVSGHSFSSSAADATVLVGSGGLVFSPATTNIAVNDRVLWVWSGNFHSTTSTQVGLWDSGVNNLPHSFTNKFTTAGSFPYECSVHFSFGMTGTVIVQGTQPTNAPPTISLVSPTNGATLIAPATFSLVASAADSDGSVTNVEFFQGTRSLGKVTNSPYSILVSNLAVGDYTFSAVATDNGALTATNSTSITVVAPVTVVLSAAQRNSPTSFQFSYTANVGSSYLVQLSADLTSTNWLNLSTNTAASSPVIFVDTNATADAGYYRVALVPNP